MEKKIMRNYVVASYLVFWAMVMGICGNANVEWYDCMNGEKTDPDYHSDLDYCKKIRKIGGLKNSNSKMFHKRYYAFGGYE